MDQSFILLKKEYKKPDNVVGFVNVINRTLLVNSICRGEDQTYKATLAGGQKVAKLCRTCISDICKQLTEEINFLTQSYKVYTDHAANKMDFMTLKMGLPAANVKEELETHAIVAKEQYNHYKALYSELIASKIVSSECIVCKKIKSN